jgi:aldehyde dehydrogenase (NAD+)
MSVEQQSRPAVRDQLYVGGAWVTPDGGGTLEVVEASTEQPLGTIPEGTAEDARRAIKAAREAFDGWAATPVSERQRLLRAIADGLDARADEIARTVTAEVGMPLKLSRMIQA